MKKYLGMFLFCIMFILPGCMEWSFSGASTEILASIGGIFLVFGAWYIFWPLIVLIFILGCYLIGDEGKRYDRYDRDYHPIGATFVFILFLLLFQFTKRFDFVGFFSENYWKLPLAFFLYFVAGALWSTFKVYDYYVVTLREFTESEKKQFLRNNGHTNQTWNDYFDKDIINRRKAEIDTRYLPKKTWIVFWPLSFLSFLFHDLFRKFLNYIVEALKNVYNYVSKRATDKVFKEFKD